MPRYFFVKLGPGNAFAWELLRRVKLGSPTVVGFFRAITIEDIEAHLDDRKARFSRQAIDLYRWSHGMIEGIGVCVAAGHVWMLEPSGPMYELEPGTFTDRVGALMHADDLPKAVPVRILATDRLTHVPTLLAQITSNRSLSSSTFKEIRDDFGNRIAVDHVLFKRGIQHDYPTLRDGTRDLYHLLLCLGANELVSLVARLLEEAGLSVPAPTGGFVKNIDLFAYNDRSHTVTVGSPAHGFLRVAPRRTFRHGGVMLQVRGAAADTRPSVGFEVDYLIQLNAEPSERVLDHAWIADVLGRSPGTLAWLERIVRWVPFSGSVLRTLRRR